MRRLQLRGSASPPARRRRCPACPAEKQSRVAAVYTYEETGLKRATLTPAKFARPEGGLFSTASDMARFHQMMLNKGTLNGTRILSAAAVEAMTTSQTREIKAGRTS